MNTPEKLRGREKGIACYNLFVILIRVEYYFIGFKNLSNGYNLFTYLYHLRSLQPLGPVNEQ